MIQVQKVKDLYCFSTDISVGKQFRRASTNSVYEVSDIVMIDSVTYAVTIIELSWNGSPAYSMTVGDFYHEIQVGKWVPAV